MKNIFLWTAVFCCFLLSQSALTQSISGIITDEYEMPLPGVSVYLKGTTLGTVSGFDGTYLLQIGEGDVTTDSITVVYSYIGYSLQEFNFVANPLMEISNNVIMGEDIETLEEFVVVGYGVQRSSEITGAVSSIKSEDLANLPVSRIDQALGGRAAGVQVNSTTGQPGENVKVRIRGVGTINNNDPLYIVDGVPTKEINGILNPEDIESMTVLKDAASAAIYGARAGNGVVIIKTKKGVSQKPLISYNGWVGVQTVGHITPMTNTDEYIEIFNEAAARDDRKPIPEDIYPQLANTDHMQSIFRPAVMTNHQLTFSGGSENSTYLIGGGYLNQQGIILNSGYERINFRTNLSTDLSEKVTIGTNLTFAFSSQDIVGGSGDGFGGNGGSVVRYAFFRTPPIPIYNEDGSYVDLPNFEGYSRSDQNTWFGDGYNPVGFANKYDWNANIYRLFGNIFLNWDIIPGLVFRTEFGVDLGVFDEKRFNENWGTDGRINNPSNMTKGMGTDFTWNWTNTLNYTKTFNEKHNLGVLIGTEAISNNRHEQWGSDREFPDQSSFLRYLGNGLTLNKGANETEVGWSLLSAFGRINYNFDNRYLIEGVIRADGSSRFAEENRWGVFYSGSLGWNIHNEKFMQNADWLNQLKLRLSVGQTGNQEIGLYNYLSIIAPGFNYPFGGLVYNGYVVSSLGNINTTWETTTTYDIGLDLAVLDDRLTFITDYYWRYTSDMLVPVPLPPSGGSADPPFVNAGEVLNQGFEAELIWREVKPNFRYEIGGNITFLNNEVLKLGGGRPIAAGRVDNGVFATLTQEGHPIGSFYMYEMEGIFQNELEIFSSAYQGPAIKPGDVKFKDVNGDNIIDENDRTHVGSAIPKILYGLNFSFSWKNVDFLIFFQGAWGNSIYMQINHDIEGFYRGFNVTKRYYENRWTGEGSTNEYPRASWLGATNNKISSTRFLESGSYIRAKNISIGYNIPFRETSRIQQLRVYFSVQNVYTYTKYPGLDPEMYDSDNLNSETVQNPDLASGIDWGTYPVPRIYTLGVNFNF
jgi:TonB-linked SusC/RagA family outer membrane protein